MKKLVFFLLYVLSVASPLGLYLFNSATGYDTYTLSIVLGVFSFIMICNQFILASRPAFIVETFGTKGLLTLHQIVPVLVVILAAIHSSLKEANGYGDSFQTLFGSLAWVTFIVVIVFSLLLMANPKWMHIFKHKSLKAWINQKTGLTYQKARVLHNITVLAGIMILIHVLLASSSDFSSNPIGLAWMVMWMIVSLGLYLVYRLKGRTLKGKQHE